MGLPSSVKQLRTLSVSSFRARGVSRIIGHVVLGRFHLSSLRVNHALTDCL